MRPASVLVVIIIGGFEEEWTDSHWNRCYSVQPEQRGRVEISIALINRSICRRDYTPHPRPHPAARHFLASRACEGEAEAHQAGHNLPLRVASMKGVASGNPGRTTRCLKAAIK